MEEVLQNGNCLIESIIHLFDGDENIDASVAQWRQNIVDELVFKLVIF